MKGFAKMFTDPENKKAMRGQQSMMVRVMYGDLAQELRLTPEETNQMMEIPPEGQMSKGERRRELMSGNTTDSTKAEASLEDYDTQLDDLLGDARAKTF